MSKILLLIAILATPGFDGTKKTTLQIVNYSIDAEKHYNLPHGILAAIAIFETSARNVIIMDGYESARVSPWLIKCTGPDIATCVKKYTNIKTAAYHVAHILSKGIEMCMKDTFGNDVWYCKFQNGWIARYRPENIEWLKGVMLKWKKLKYMISQSQA
jgi:hypothetical protein